MTFELLQDYAQLQELQAKLARLDVIDPSKINQNRVAFGAKVRIIDLETDEEKEFHLVGP